MKTIISKDLLPSEAAIWWLGQAGYVIRAAGLTVVIDPYLSNSAGEGSPRFSRLYDPPVKASELEADIYIITHDHLDHLDPETLSHYAYKENTCFVAPRLAAKKLSILGIPENRIVVVGVGEQWIHEGLEINGVFALPTGIDVLDTTGFFLKFSNGRTVYHTSDTQMHPLVLAAAPRQPELMLVPINGKWGNTGPEQAAEFAQSVQPTYVMPNHYDLMSLNSENPESFKWFCENKGLPNRCIIPERMQPFVWFFKN
jgi:L-ascorbate 6-phosphate lactonase